MPVPNIPKKTSRPNRIDSTLSLKKLIYFLGVILLVFTVPFLLIQLLRSSTSKQNAIGNTELPELPLGCTDSYAKLAELQKYGTKTLDEIVTHPDLQITYRSPIGRLNRKTGKLDYISPPLGSIKERRLSALREIANREKYSCAHKKLLQRITTPPGLNLPEDAYKDEKIAQIMFANIDMGIQLLIGAHVAKLNQGTRCGELVSIAALHMINFMQEQNFCLNMQKRSAWIKGDDHAYLLISFNDLEKYRTKPLTDFSRQDRETSFILDPFRDIFGSVAQILAAPEKYPYFAGYNHPFLEHTPIHTCVAEVDIKRIDPHKLFKTELAKVMKTFKQSFYQNKEALPQEYVCKDTNVYSHAISYFNQRLRM